MSEDGRENLITCNACTFQVVGVDPIGSIIADPEHSEVSSYEVCNIFIGPKKNNSHP